MSAPKVDQLDTLAEWLRRRPAKPVGSAREGSNPSGVAFCATARRSQSSSAPVTIRDIQQHWSSGYDDCLTRSRSPVQSWDAVIIFFPLSRFLTAHMKSRFAHFIILLQQGSWCSGITSASHAEGPGFKSQWVHCSQFFLR